MIKYVKCNFSNVVSALQEARRFGDSEINIKSSGRTGDIHKVLITYVPQGSSIFKITINENEMGGPVADFGDAYDLIMDCVL